jgi:beta-glucosidase-like glycosyl hydrolase
MNPYRRLIPRLNGAEIEERFDSYLSLVKKGIGGFILFGGDLETVRAGVRKLQNSSRHPLIIASDLEQGLGQQVKGGTLFPPAMALAAAVKAAETADPSLPERVYRAFALEAAYAGINVILAPVLDINTNPANPIIATRAFGENRETVSYLGCAMIRTLQQRGIIACGKHFPGHGDTEIDSHVSLPTLKKDLTQMEKEELVPFQKAIHAEVAMIMLGHLGVPALDPSGTPATLSQKVVSFLRKKMGFTGLLITDAMNMGGIAGYDKNEAAVMALSAGVDLILHPTDPDRAAALIAERHCPVAPLDLSIPEGPDTISPDFDAHRRLSEYVTQRAISIEGSNVPKIRKPFVVILDEDREGKDFPFIDALKKRYPETVFHVLQPGQEMPWQRVPKDHELIVALFSTVRAWKTVDTEWLKRTIESLSSKARLFISFGNPYALRDLRNESAKIFAFWSSEAAQRAVAETGL